MLAYVFVFLHFSIKTTLLMKPEKQKLATPSLNALKPVDSD